MQRNPDAGVREKLMGRQTKIQSQIERQGDRWRAAKPKGRKKNAISGQEGRKI